MMEGGDGLACHPTRRTPVPDVFERGDRFMLIHALSADPDLVGLTGLKVLGVWSISRSIPRAAGWMSQSSSKCGSMGGMGPAGMNPYPYPMDVNLNNPDSYILTLGNSLDNVAESLQPKVNEQNSHSLNEEERLETVMNTSNKDKENPTKSMIVTNEPHIPTRPRKKKYKPAPVSCFDQLFGRNAWSRFLVLKSDERIPASVLENRLLSEYSTKNMTFRTLNDNEWLIETTTQEQSETYMALDKIGNINIQFSKHDTLNSIIGTVVLPNDIVEEELNKHILLDSLQKRYGNVQDLEIFEVPSKKTRNGKIRIAKIKFEGKELPPNLKLLGITRELREFVPKPLQCALCSMYGHSDKRCRNQPCCACCSSTNHATKWDCEEKKCANCGENHHSRSKNCIFYLYNAELKLLQSRTGMSIREAKVELKVRGFPDPARNLTYKNILQKRNPKLPQEQAPELHTPIPTSNKFDVLAFLNKESNQIKQNEELPEQPTEKVDYPKEDPKPRPSTKQSHQPSSPHVDRKKRSLDNGTPPKSKKANNEENSEKIEISYSESLVSSVLETTAPTAIGTESETCVNPSNVEFSTPSETDPHTITDITPSPIIGATGKSKDDPKSSKISHDLLCGCNHCFLSEFHAIKDLSVHKLKNHIDNFIKNKKRNVYGNIEQHPAGCMCVEHLIRKRTSGALQITKFIEKNKQEKSTDTGAKPKVPKSDTKDSQPHINTKSGSPKVTKSKILSRGNISISS